MDVARAIFHRAEPGTNQTPPESTVSILPAVSASPTEGVGAGGALSMASRRAGPGGSLSSAQAGFMFTTKKQLMVVVTNDVHSRSEAWTLVGDMRFYKFVQGAPPLGSGHPADAAPVDVGYKWIRAYQTAYRHVAGPFHLGAGYHLDSYIGIRPQEGQGLPTGVSAVFPVTTVASGVSLDALFDSRDNPLNAERGVYGRRVTTTTPP